ncbi:MAG TPA: hypothetical protein VF691_14925, partial [Cytophagaceae bacterium]
MMKSIWYKWLLSPFIAYFFVIYSCSCGNKKNKNSDNSTGLFSQKPAESIDSAYLEKFLLQNPSYEDHRKKLFKFYTRRKFQLAWSDKGELKPQAQMFINMVQDLSSDGVTPAKYNATSLRGLYNLVDSKG